MKNNRTITEAKIQELSDKLYGVDPIERMEKLNEEVAELDEAVINYGYSPTPKNLEKVKDELSDCLFVLVSKFKNYNTNFRELAEMAINKSKQREINPNFKRLK